MKLPANLTANTMIMVAMLTASHLRAAARAIVLESGTVVKLQLRGGRPVVDRVFLNGHGPYRFLLDTGAQTNQIDAHLAQELALTPTFRVDLYTPGGVTRVPGTRVMEVTLGSVRATDQEFLFTALDGVRALSSDIQGVLGQEFLSRFDYLLDLRNRILAFDVPPPAGERIPTERINSRPALVSRWGRLVLDSGSDTVVLFHAGPGGSGSGSLRTASGIVPFQTISGQCLRIGGRNYRPALTALISQPDLIEDGILPLGLFKAVYISNSGSYVVVQ